MNTRIKLFAAAMSAMATLTAMPASADNYAMPKNPLYTEECASCHMAYPAQMLDGRSWQALMGGLSKHFGTDASLDEKRRVAIADFLQANAGGRKTGVTADAAGKPLLRISETARFVRKHREVAPATFSRASIKSPGNCSACHTRAEAGDFEERNVTIPK